MIDDPRRMSTSLEHAKTSEDQIQVDNDKTHGSQLGVFPVRPLTLETSIDSWNSHRLVGWRIHIDTSTPIQLTVPAHGTDVVTLDLPGPALLARGLAPRNASGLDHAPGDTASLRFPATLSIGDAGEGWRRGAERALVR